MLDSSNVTTNYLNPVLDGVVGLRGGAYQLHISHYYFNISNFEATLNMKLFNFLFFSMQNVSAMFLG